MIRFDSVTAHRIPAICWVLCESEWIWLEFLSIHLQSLFILRWNYLIFVYFYRVILPHSHSACLWTLQWLMINDLDQMMIWFFFLIEPLYRKKKMHFHWFIIFPFCVFWMLIDSSISFIVHLVACRLSLCSCSWFVDWSWPYFST